LNVSRVIAFSLQLTTIKMEGGRFCLEQKGLSISCIARGFKLKMRTWNFTAKSKTCARCGARTGDADPNEEELLQWRQATCRRLVEKGSDICSVAWVVPLWVDSGVAGYALFLCDLGGAESDVPELVGVFENRGEEKSRLLLEGAVASF
jgi:hypothetical protein